MLIPLQIGPYRIEPPLVLAPMAGVTDRAFRTLCRRLGAGLAVAEMSTSDPRLWHTEKSRLRREHDPESAPISVQIAGSDPQAMADSARFQVEHGAQMVDINMGCPAKKVCRVDAGSALLRDAPRVERILRAVVAAVSVPVTLKMRTGWSPDARNGVQIARIAQDCGIAALSVHGRTRADRFDGMAEYDTIAEIKQAVDIPVIANGDIDSGEKALQVLRHTAADGLMIGRAALGHPWIFGEIDHHLRHGRARAAPEPALVCATLLEHLRELHRLYGPTRGVRVGRKHIQWYCQSHPGAQVFWQRVSCIEDAQAQLQCVSALFNAGDDHRLSRAA